MTKTINLSLPEELLKQIDAAAKGEYASRSDFVRETLVRRLKGQRIVDEWGDPAGEWGKEVDLRDEQGRGVPVENVLKALKNLREYDEQNRKTSPKTKR